MQSFFGPWSLRATTQQGFFSERFEIVGSDGLDGIFFPDEDGTPLELAVTGASWTLDLQAKLSDSDWFSYDAARTTAIIPPQGLTVTLASEQIEEPTGLVLNHLLVVQCVSDDPTINPPWPTIPVDFSLPD